MSGRSPRWLIIILAVSLALNLFLLGFFSARWLLAPDDGPGEAGPPFLGPRALLGSRLPDVPEAQRVLAEHHDELRAQRRAIRSARREVHAALVATPFDAAALTRALAALREQTTQSQATLHRALVELASELSPEQRARLAQAMRKSHRGAPRRGDRHAE